MKKGKIFIFDGILALVIIAGLSSCDKQFNSKQTLAAAAGNAKFVASLVRVD